MAGKTPFFVIWCFSKKKKKNVLAFHKCSRAVNWLFSSRIWNGNLEFEVLLLLGKVEVNIKRCFSMGSVADGDAMPWLILPRFSLYKGGGVYWGVITIQVLSRHRNLSRTWLKQLNGEDSLGEVDSCSHVSPIWWAWWASVCPCAKAGSGSGLEVPCTSRRRNVTLIPEGWSGRGEQTQERLWVCGHWVFGWRNLKINGSGQWTSLCEVWSGAREEGIGALIHHSICRLLLVFGYREEKVPVKTGLSNWSAWAWEKAAGHATTGALGEMQKPSSHWNILCFHLLWGLSPLPWFRPAWGSFPSLAFFFLSMMDLLFQKRCHQKGGGGGCVWLGGGRVRAQHFESKLQSIGPGSPPTDTSTNGE